MPFQFTSADGLLILEGGTKKAIRWDDGKLLSKLDIFRLSFSGVTMISSTCTDYGCVTSPQFRRMRVVSGTLNSVTVDAPFTTCLSGSAWGSPLTAMPSCEWGNASCNNSASSGGGGVNLPYTGPSVGKFVVACGLTAAGNHVFFDAAFDICDLADGMVINNNFTAGGCGTRLINGAACNVYAFGGTCTLTRVCPP